LQLAVLKAFAVGEFLSLLRQKKETKEKATPDRSKARNKINGLRQRRNSRAANVSPLKHIWTLPKVKHDDPQQLHRSCFFVNYISVILLTMRRAIAS
jgi:hypothetical protein